MNGPSINMPDPSCRLTAGEVMERAEQAVQAACEFFAVSSEWSIRVRAETPAAGTASIEQDGVYMRATIRLDVTYFQQHPADIWGDMGHEVAHLVTTEMPQLWCRLPDEIKEGPLKEYYAEAVERATVRLERLFLRHCPTPKEWS